jgi:hypothetical protein
MPVVYSMLINRTDLDALGDQVIDEVSADEPAGTGN